MRTLNLTLTAFGALMGSSQATVMATDADTNATIVISKDDFMAKFGPDKATRIALDRKDGVAMIIFSNVDGPKPDGATEMLQAAKVWEDGPAATVLVQLQRITHKVRMLDEDETRDLIAGMVAYLDTMLSVILLAKCDKTLDLRSLFLLNHINGGEVISKNFEMNGFLVTDRWIYIQIGDVIGKIEEEMLEANRVNDSRSLLNGATTIVDSIPSWAKLARGPKVALGGKIIDTVAYVTQDGDGDTAKMTLLDDENLEKVMEIPFDGDYATAGDGDNIYVMAHLEATDEITGEKIETFPFSRTPAAEFLQAFAA